MKKQVLNFLLSICVFSFCALPFLQAQNSNNNTVLSKIPCNGTAITKNLAPMLMCEGDSMKIVNETFFCANASPASQTLLQKATINDPNACDTLYKFVLQCVKINPIVVPANPTFDCNNLEIKLNAGNSVFLPTSSSVNLGVKSYLWSNGATTSSITVSKTGTYTVTISYQYTLANAFGSVTKSSSKVVSIKVNGYIELPAKPFFLASKPTPKLGDTVTYTIDNPISLFTYKWKITGGTASNLEGKSISVTWGNTPPFVVCATASYLCGSFQNTSLPTCLNVTPSFTLSEEIKIEDESLVLYPNPTSEILSIQLPNALHISQLEIFNILGQNVEKQKIDVSQKIMNIGISNWLSGSYVVLFKNEKGEKIAMRSFLKI